MIMNNDIEKTEFFEILEDGSIPASKSKILLEKIPHSTFMSLDKEEDLLEKRKSLWTEEYFRTQSSHLQRINFSKELCDHLINVKSYLQDIGAKGFSITDSLPKEVSSIEENLTEREKSIDIPLSSISEYLNDPTELLKNYNPEKNLEEAIVKNDINEVQSILKFNLNNNRLAIKDVLQTILFVSQRFPEALPEYQIDKFSLATSEDENVWDRNYFFLQQSYLNHNFAVERLMHLINVRDYLAQKGVEGFKHIKVQPKPESNQTSGSYSNSEKSSHKKQENSFIKTAVIIGGAVLAGILALIAKLR